MKNLKITVNGVAYDVQVEEVSAGAPTANQPAASAAPVTAAPAPAAPGAEVIVCPMPGTILDIKVSEGAAVREGDVLFILEAMKMENEIVAPRDAVIAAIHIKKGDPVESGTPLASLS